MYHWQWTILCQRGCLLLLLALACACNLQLDLMSTNFECSWFLLGMGDVIIKLHIMEVDRMLLCGLKFNCKLLSLLDSITDNLGLSAIHQLVPCSLVGLG